jgi:transcriptional regulator with XRE-family HTH domain
MIQRSHDPTMGRKQARDRAAAQAEKVGGAIRTARAISGFSVAAASARAGIADSTWRRVEHGAVGASVATLCAMSEAVGLDFVAHLYPGREPRLRDTGQLELAHVISAMVSDPSTVSLEVPAGDHGEAIDMVLWRPDEILAIEIERLVLDAQAQLRRLNLKRDWLAARHQRRVRLVVIVEDTRRNRTALDPHMALLRTTLPAGSREVFGAIRSGRALGRDGLAWLRRP